MSLNLISVISTLLFVITSLISSVFSLFCFYIGSVYLYSFIITTFVSVFLGFIVNLFIRNIQFSKSKSSLILTLFSAWFLFPFIFSIPFLSSNIGVSFSSIYFESISMFTTTGFNVIGEVLQNDLVLIIWRTFIQWIGGLYSILMYIVILIFITDRQRLELTFYSNKVRYVYLVLKAYLLLTASCFFLLLIQGNSFFDSLSATLVINSTGGVTSVEGHLLSNELSNTYNLIIFSIFMVLSATCIPVLLFSNDFTIKDVVRNERLKKFGLILILIMIIISVVSFYKNFSQLDSLFIAISLLTTNGMLPSSLQDKNIVLEYKNILLLLVSFTIIGGMSGSACGGFKNFRVWNLFNTIMIEIEHLFHKHGIWRKGLKKGESSLP